MRLTDTQVRIIKARAAECFGPNAKIWLFGSRVDDKALSGDIDLYVELTEPFTDAAALRQAFGAQRYWYKWRKKGPAPNDNMPPASRLRVVTKNCVAGGHREPRLPTTISGVT